VRGGRERHHQVGAEEIGRPPNKFLKTSFMGVEEGKQKAFGSEGS